jgi:hypothetical protein
MKGIGRSIVSTALLIVGVQAIAQAPATPAPASKPISTSLGMVVFPAKGQTPQQQAQDEGECYAWSKGQTGVDPMAPPPAAAQPAAQSAQKAPAADGSRLRGAARGAAAGAVSAKWLTMPARARRSAPRRVSVRQEPAGGR